MRVAGSAVTAGTSRNAASGGRESAYARMPDPWIQPAREVAGERVCGRCAAIIRPPLGVGWVATTDPFPAWVCPECTRETGMQPGDPIPVLTGQ